SVSHLVPSGSPFIGGKGVNHIQDGTYKKQKGHRIAVAFLFSPSFIFSIRPRLSFVHPMT
ncbi:hypothetical protein J1F21_02400, partial [Aeromonas veronii]|uniref:hypothetical protein n=1 Tax=Aeromonas veronii TaxID=654 RepID=UPI001A8DA182